MKLLTRITLVNWYLFTAKDIPVVGSTAIIGENGAGKSALMDAVQSILAGANRSKLALNRGSNERSSRKLYEYALGIVSDPKKLDADTKIRPREKAQCYIGLNFFDTDSKETCFVGLGLWATLAEIPAERIEGFFICPGLVGHTGLFLDTREGQQVVMEWQRVKSRMEQLCPGARFFNQSSRFTKELYHELSYDRGAPNSADTIIKTIQAAFKLDKISSPTQFLRDYFLEEDNLQISELASALKNYRLIEQKTASVRVRVEKLTEIESLCDRCEHNRIQHAMVAANLPLIQMEVLQERANPLRIAIGDLEDLLEDGRKEWAQLGKDRDNLFSDLGSKRSELKNFNIVAQRESIQAAIDKLSWQEEQPTSELHRLRGMLSRMISYAPQVPLAEGLSKFL